MRIKSLLNVVIAFAQMMRNAEEGGRGVVVAAAEEGEGEHQQHAIPTATSPDDDQDLFPTGRAHGVDGGDPHCITTFARQ